MMQIRSVFNLSSREHGRTAEAIFSGYDFSFNG